MLMERLVGRSQMGVFCWIVVVGFVRRRLIFASRVFKRDVQGKEERVVLDFDFASVL